MVELLALRASPVGLLVELLAELLGRAISLHLGHGRRRAKGRMAWQDAHIPSDHTAVELLALHPAAREKLKEMLTSNCAHPVRISHCGYETAQRMHDFAHNVHMSLCMALHTMCAARIAQRRKMTTRDWKVSVCKKYCEVFQKHPRQSCCWVSLVS